MKPKKVLKKRNKYYKAAQEMNEKICEVLINRMKERKMTQNDVGKIVGKSRANVSLILRQLNIISIPTLIEFCKALGLKFDIVFTEVTKDEQK